MMMKLPRVLGGIVGALVIILLQRKPRELNSLRLEFPKADCLWRRKRALQAVRVKGGMSLRNSMWHGVRNGIIMPNTIYVGNKLTEERVMFSRQFDKSNREQQLF